MGSSNSKAKAKSKSSTNTNYHPTQGESGIRRKYTMGKLLGSGSFGKVILAKHKLDNSQQVAIKMLRTKDPRLELQKIQLETRILQSLDHPNIVKYYETLFGREYIYIVMEYCSGDKFVDYILEKGEGFNEIEAAGIIKDILKALSHCHANGITHRDIKPENILFEKKGDHAHVKLIDFGLSSPMGEDSELQLGGGRNSPPKKVLKRGNKVGTPYYVAPEVLSGLYGYPCDIWSLGVIMYVLLTGYLPFGGGDVDEVLQKLIDPKVSFDKLKEWERVSLEAKDLNKGMLITNPKKRLTAVQCLKHPWFAMVESMKKKGGEVVNLDVRVLDSIKEHKLMSTFQKEVMNELVKELKGEEISKLTEQFELIDIDKTGYITPGELSQALADAGNILNAKQVESIVKNIDYYGNKKINYSEFIAATLDCHKFLTKERLWILFKHFDTDNTNYITHGNLKEALAHSGKEVYDFEVEEMIKDHDIEKNGKISFKEFRTMMNKMVASIDNTKLDQITAQGKAK